MRLHTLFLPVAISLLSTNALWAQEADKPADAGAAEQTETVEIGQIYVKKQEGDWAIRCERAPLGQEDPCQIQQLIKGENGNPIAEVTLVTVADEDGEAVAKMNIFVPLGTYLPAGIQVAIDGRAAGRIPFLVCDSQRCLSEITLKAADVQAFKAGGQAEMLIASVRAPGEPVQLVASLKGFTAAYNELAGAQ